MKVEPTALPGVLLVEPVVRRDERGAFVETFRRTRYEDAGLPADWVQDNLSRSRRGVLRGLHFQHPGGQGKLVSAARGEILDVAVDVRAGSPHFGRSVAVELTADNARQLYVPAGFAHGFFALSDEATVLYKCTTYYDPATEHTLAWDDPALGIPWPAGAPVLSEKDARGRRLADFAPHELPPYGAGA